MPYIDPHQSDGEFIRSDGRLSRRQAREDYQSARGAGGLDAAISRSKETKRPRLDDGFKPIPGTSRSGATDPAMRTKMERQEADGLVQLQREPSGRVVGYRPVDRT